MDNELFELCKGVYERTKWGYTDESINIADGEVLKSAFNTGYVGEEEIVFPLYTSDYLLEKLPRNIGSYGLEMWSYPSGDGVAFGYYDVLKKEWHTTIPQRGDQLPLKALLKLTLALHEAGELS